MVLFSSIGKNGGQGNAGKLVAVFGLFEERRRGWYRKRRGRRGMGQIFFFLIGSHDNNNGREGEKREIKVICQGLCLFAGANPSVIVSGPYVVLPGVSVA